MDKIFLILIIIILLVILYNRNFSLDYYILSDPNSPYQFFDKKMLVRDNATLVEKRISSTNKFKETSKTFVFPQLIQLRSVLDVDEMNVDSLVGLTQ